MKHYGELLPWARRPVKDKASDIMNLKLRIEKMQKDLEQQITNLVESEKEFEEFIAGEWTEEEISKAKDEAYHYNNYKKIL